MVLVEQPDGTADTPRGQPARERDVVFVLPHMGPGGAQRVVSLVANAWAREGKRIAILTWNEGRTDTHHLDPRVERFELDHFSRSLHVGVVRKAWWFSLEGGRQLERRLRPLWKPQTVKESTVRANPGLERRPIPASQGRGAPTVGSASFKDQSPDDPSSEDQNRGAHSGRKRKIRTRLTDRIVLSMLRRMEKDGSDVRPGSFAAAVRSFLLRRALGRRVVVFREALAALDAPVVVSLLTRTNLYVLCAANAEKTRVIVSERNDPDLQQLDGKASILRELLYRKADVVTSNSAGVLTKLQAFVPADKLEILPNPVAAPTVTQNNAPRGLKFVTVARLVHQKGIDLLLDAFARIAREIPEWNLDVVGDGPLLEELIAQAKQLGIADRVTFHGYVAGPTAILQSGRVFVLPSRFEGMPNALLEAMACGLAPIVTDASPGPLESVKHEVTGFVVPTENSEAIAAAMLRLASDEELVKHLAAQARAYIKEHDWTAVEPQWLHVLGLEIQGVEAQPVQALGTARRG